MDGFISNDATGKESININHLQIEGDYYVFARVEHIGQNGDVKFPFFQVASYFDCEENYLTISGNNPSEYTKIERLQRSTDRQKHYLQRTGHGHKNVLNQRGRCHRAGRKGRLVKNRVFRKTAGNRLDKKRRCQLISLVIPTRSHFQMRLKTCQASSTLVPSTYLFS
jgi:hypothetical protein